MSASTIKHPDPGPGWTLLQDGAQRRAGDERWDHCAQAWREIEPLMIGAIYSTRYHAPHRRRTDAPTRRDPLGGWTGTEEVTR